MTTLQIPPTMQRAMEREAAMLDIGELIRRVNAD